MGPARRASASNRVTLVQQIRPYALTVAVIAAAVGVPGCFAYRAADPAAVRPGQEVRVTLTPAGAAEVTPQVGPRVEMLDGRLIAPRDSALAVAVTQLTRGRGGEEFWTGDSVIVPVRGVSSLFVRELDRNRTWLAVGATAIAVVVMRRVVEQAGVFGNRPNPSPGSQ
jgi:hypothetical protein